MPQIQNTLHCHAYKTAENRTWKKHLGQDYAVTHEFIVMCYVCQNQHNFFENVFLTTFVPSNFLLGITSCALYLEELALTLVNKVSPSKMHFSAVRGHSNNTWHSREEEANTKCHMIFFVVLNSCIKAFGRNKSCLKARIGFK